MTDNIPDMAERSMRERIARALCDAGNDFIGVTSDDGEWVMYAKEADTVLAMVATFLRERGKRLNAHALDVELTIAELLEATHEE